MIEVLELSAAAARGQLSALAAILVDCVEGGASVSFMWPFTQRDAEQFYNKIIDGIERGERLLLAAYEGDTLLGSVQIVTAMPPNQPHRAEIAKLLVHRSARGKGIGTALMEAVEKHAKALGKTLLMLDSVTGGDGERLYLRLNWTKAAVIPNFAMFPDGRWCDTTILWKTL